MRAVGEALGLGRTFPEALLKALEGVEAGDALPEIPGLHPVLRRRDRVDPRRRARARRRRRRRRRQALRASRRANRPDPRRLRGGRAQSPWPAGPAGRRLLRRRVRGADAVLLPLVRERRRRGDRDGSDRRARLGHEPDRPGDRVRLLLRARGAGVPPARARGRARELESGDRLDRLRHLRPPLSRAGDAGARPRRGRARAAARRRSLARRPDAARRSPPASRRRACRCSAIRSTPSTPRRTAAASARCSPSSACGLLRGAT